MIYSRRQVFAAKLVDYSEARVSLGEFHAWVINVLIDNGPTIRRDNGELSADFSFEADCAMYLDMVTDADDPNFNELEARRLARSLAAISVQVTDPGTAADLAHFARWASDTVAQTRLYLAGDLSRAAFERFLSRRPWPHEHRNAVKRLTSASLARFVDGLENDNYVAVVSALNE